MTICTKCHQECEVVTLRWKEREEFWGAPCWREESEDRSACCNAEVYEENK